MTDAMHGEHTHFEVVMVRIETDEGASGIGYTYTIGKGGCAIQSIIEKAFTPLLLGSNPRMIESLWEQMWWDIHYIGRGGITSFAISAVDTALWDLCACVDRVPLWQYLGGYHNKVTPYAGGIDLHLSLEELVEQTRCNLEKGFTAIKIKVGQPHLHDDIRRVRAIRDLLGEEKTLMVDANMRWDVQTAIRAARMLREYDVFWLEEPTIPDDYLGMARIGREGGIPIATGENLHTIYEFRHMIDFGQIAFPEPDVSNIGGITNWMRVAKLAQANNLPVTTHGVHELHLHLLSAVPNASFLEVHSFGLERFILNPPKIINGQMIAGSEPGHGVQFDWDALKEHIAA
ncbi:MAG: mandelate racemase/muconate lactonizing enzyme family protein [Chloroflexota bacterium]